MSVSAFNIFYTLPMKTSQIVIRIGNTNGATIGKYTPILNESEKKAGGFKVFV